MNRPITVFVVDDSAFIRYTVTKHLETDPEIKVIGMAGDGVEAMAKIPSLNPDVVIMDVEMPRMDGLTALKRIMAEDPRPVVMLSSLTRKGTQTTIRALIRGAFDFVPKPDGMVNLHTVMDELREKIKAAAKAPFSKTRLSGTQPLAPPVKQGPRLLQQEDALIVIGASTGGPHALNQVLTALPADLPAALLIVQHMPPKFTRSLAERLNSRSPLIVQEAAEGDRLARGLALLAQGDFHMRLRSERQVTLDQGPKCHHVRPAIDVTMESAVKYYGRRMIGVVLTGMGSDGTDGARLIKAAGGLVIAEHESTSVVYGMPASVVKAGLADAVVPISKVAQTIVNLLKRERSRI